MKTNSVDSSSRVGQDSTARDWVSLADSFPPPGKPVLASLLTPSGRRRCIRAHHSPPHTIDASHWEDGDTDDTEDGSYEPEGWWEDPWIGERLEFVGMTDGEITHWMLFPADPVDQASEEQIALTPVSTAVDQSPKEQI